MAFALAGEQTEAMTITQSARNNGPLSGALIPSRNRQNETVHLQHQDSL